MSQPTKAELLKQLLELGEPLTQEEILAVCKCSKATFLQMSYMVTNLGLAYTDDDGRIVPVEHPAVKKLVLAEAEVQQLKLEREKDLPYIEFSKSFKAMMSINTKE
jgi:hypothetical protein